MGSRGVAIPAHIDPPAQGSLTVQSVVFQMLTAYEPTNLGGVLFQSIHPADLSVKGDQPFYIKRWDDSLKQSGLSNLITYFLKCVFCLVSLCIVFCLSLFPSVLSCMAVVASVLWRKYWQTVVESNYKYIYLSTVHWI